MSGKKLKAIDNVTIWSPIILALITGVIAYVKIDWVAGVVLTLTSWIIFFEFSDVVVKEIYRVESFKTGKEMDEKTLIKNRIIGSSIILAIFIGSVAGVFFGWGAGIAIVFVVWILFQPILGSIAGKAYSMKFFEPAVKEVEKQQLSVEGLIKALGDEQTGDYDSYVEGRAKIKEELGEIGEPAVKPLIKALEDKNSRVRIGAAGALGKIKDKRAVGPLIQALEDENNIVRAEAAYALGEIGDSRAIKPLERILLLWNTMPPGLIKEARTALEKLK